MRNKPVPKFSRVDKVISVLEAAADVGCAVIIVRGIKNPRWKTLYTALVITGGCLEAFGFLKGVVRARRPSDEIEPAGSMPVSHPSSARRIREPGTEALAWEVNLVLVRSSLPPNAGSV